MSSERFPKPALAAGWMAAVAIVVPTLVGLLFYGGFYFPITRLGFAAAAAVMAVAMTYAFPDMRAPVRALGIGIASYLIASLGMYTYSWFSPPGENVQMFFQFGLGEWAGGWLSVGGIVELALIGGSGFLLAKRSMADAPPASSPTPVGQPKRGLRVAPILGGIVVMALGIVGAIQWEILQRGPRTLEKWDVLLTAAEKPDCDEVTSIAREITRPAARDAEKIDYLLGDLVDNTIRLCRAVAGNANPAEIVELASENSPNIARIYDQHAERAGRIAAVLPDYARTRARERIDEAEVGTLKRYCDPKQIEAIDALGSKRGTEVMLECVHASLAKSDAGKATERLAAVLERQDAGRYARERAGLEKELFELEQKQAAERAAELAKLPPLPKVGTTGDEGPPRVLITNASTSTISISMNGKLYSLPPGKQAPNVTAKSGSPCSNKLPSLNARMPPDAYSVVARVVGNSSVRPFYGAWKVENGGIYANCLYIKTTRVPTGR